VTGSVSQINELRAGHLDINGNFVDAPGGSLINDRAIRPEDTGARAAALLGGDSRRGRASNLRTSLNTLGDGFVEAISNETLLAIAAKQPNDAGAAASCTGKPSACPSRRPR
jgi:hypothetical protein